MWPFFKELFLVGFGKRYYFYLFLLLFGLIGGFYACTTNFLNQTMCNLWLKDLLLNLIAEVFGILIFLYFVNRIVRSNKESEKKKFQEIAFRQLKMGLYKQVYLWFYMYKASVKEKPVRLYQKIEDLFDEIYFKELEFLDLLKVSPNISPMGEEMDWLDYVYLECNNLRIGIDKVVDRYSFYLDSEVVDLMEEVANAGLIRFITSIREAKQWGDLGLRGDLLSECKPLLKEYTQALLKILELYNKTVSFEKQIQINAAKWEELWDNNVRPKIGESRIQT